MLNADEPCFGSVPTLALALYRWPQLTALFVSNDEYFAGPTVSDMDETLAVLSQCRALHHLRVRSMHGASQREPRVMMPVRKALHVMGALVARLKVAACQMSCLCMAAFRGPRMD